MGFCGVFWRLHLTARSRETHRHTQGCKGSRKKRRASKSSVRERIRARKSEMARVVGKRFLKARSRVCFGSVKTTRGPGTHFVRSIRNGLMAEGGPLRPICCSTTGGGGGTQQNTCCRCCFRHSVDWSDEHAAICDPSLKLHPGHFLQAVAPADTSGSVM